MKSDDRNGHRAFNDAAAMLMFTIDLSIPDQFVTGSLDRFCSRSFITRGLNGVFSGEPLGRFLSLVLTTRLSSGYKTMLAIIVLC